MFKDVFVEDSGHIFETLSAEYCYDLNLPGKALVILKEALQNRGIQSDASKGGNLTFNPRAEHQIEQPSGHGRKDGSLGQPISGMQVLPIPGSLGPQQSACAERRVGFDPFTQRIRPLRPTVPVERHLLSPHLGKEVLKRIALWIGVGGHAGSKDAAQSPVAEARIEDLLRQLLIDLFHELGFHIEKVARRRKIREPAEGPLKVQVGIQGVEIFTCVGCLASQH